MKVSCLCPGPTKSGFRARAGTGKTRLGATSTVMASMPVAEMGCRAFEENRRVMITGGRNAFTARLVPFLPRERVLKIVRNLQEPAS